MQAGGDTPRWFAEPDADLGFDMSKVPDPTRFDGPAHGVEHWKKVDFVCHWPADKELWLVEVKDPDNPYSLGDPAFQIEEFKSKALIQESLAPKAKDSFLYLLLEDRLPKDTLVKYLVLFACEQLPAAKRAKYWQAANAELRRRLGLRGPHGQGWAKQHTYIQDCMILSLSDWNRVVGARVQVQRASAVGGDLPNWG